MTYLTPNGKASLGSGIAFTALASIAVGLRILSKTYTKASWAADDSWAVVGLVALFALITAEFWGLFAGGGGLNVESILLKHESATSENYFKSLYMLHPLYALSVTATKLSILCLYQRIFAVRIFKQISFAVAAICVSWWAAFTITALFPCYPVKRMWQHQIKGHCYDFNTFFLASGVVDVLLDAIILSLPIKMISRLQMPYKKKVMLCFVFLIGGFAVITGIVRTYLTCVPNSPNRELWTNVHLGAAILSACLPTFPPLVSRLGGLGSTIVSNLRAFFGTRGPSRTATDEHPLKHYDNLTGPAGEGQHSRETIAGRSMGGHAETECEAYPTTVEKTVHIV